MYVIKFKSLENSCEPHVKENLSSKISDAFESGSELELGHFFLF